MAGNVLASVKETTNLSSPDNSTNQVSWQSAFLGLVPLALNAMTQPSSLDFNLPESSLLFAARSSPFICVADTLEVLMALCFYMYQEGNIFEDARLVNWRIARTRLGNGASGLEASAVGKHPKTFLILFVVTLVQAVKVFGLQGLLWTRLWAGIYLYSFVVLAIVRALAPAGWRDSPPPVEALARLPLFHDMLLQIFRIMLLVVAGAVHASVSCWVSICVHHQYEDIYQGSVVRMAFLKVMKESLSPIVAMISTGTFTFLVCISFMGPQILLENTSTATNTGIENTSTATNIGIENTSTATNTWVPLVVANLVFIVHGYVSFAFDLVHQDIATGYTSIVLCFGLLFLLFTIMVVLSKKVPFFSFLKFNDGDYRALLVFPFFNFIVALLYYWYAYDPIGTVKPSWTENLG